MWDYCVRAGNVRFISDNGHCKKIIFKNINKYQKAMIRRNKKTRKYLSPRVVSTDLALESNFCNTNLQFGIQAGYEVDELVNEDDTEIYDF